ncbi:retinitis pigmentosa 1-like 1 protein [Trichomycterus rosablanca]|uniref:retinitis pigmentosa 1-like 1 protein n=1 Tax=Trichomycterus rosablanca TaxID=2290929 RepID=UPI002F355F3E
MDRLWTWFPTRRRGSYSLAEPDTPNINEAKEKKTGKKKWKNIFSRDRKPKDAGKLLKEALEGQVRQQPEGDEGLELHSSLEDISPGVLELHADTEAGALKNTSLDETRGDTEMLLSVEEFEAEAEALTNTSLDETRDISLDKTRGNAEMLLPVSELEAEPEVLNNTSLDETKDVAEMLLPVSELEAEPEVLNNTSLDETKDVAEMLLPVSELEAEPEVLNNTSLDETKDVAEMLLSVRELEAEAEALKDLIKTSLVESEETELQNRGDNEADLFSNGDDGGITGEHGRRKKIRRGTRGRGRKIYYKKKDNNGSEIINEVKVEAEAEAEAEVLTNTSLDETKDVAEMLLPVSELEAEPEVLNNTSLDETKDVAGMLLPVRELEAEAEALKDLIKTSLVESEETELQNRGDTEADLFSNGDDGGITGEHGQRKKIRRGTRGRGRKINYKKKDNNGSEIINEVKAEAEAEAEVAEMKNVHSDEKDSSADLLNPDQPLGEERKQWIGRGDPEDGMKQKKIRRGTRGLGRKIIYKKDASKAEESAAGFNH